MSLPPDERKPFRAFHAHLAPDRPPAASIPVVRIAWALVLLLTPAAAAGQAQETRSGCEERLAAMVLVQTLNARILASRSATAALEAWCAARRLAPEPTVRVLRAPGAAKAPDAEQLERLHVARAEELRYRRVQLVCGGRVLSEADNWYVPDRLTSVMNHLLETTDTPFGPVVRPLEPYRLTFAANLLWQPLQEGWEGRPVGALCPAPPAPLAVPVHLFEHRAVLFTGAGQPFAEVRERYTREVVAGPGAD